MRDKEIKEREEKKMKRTLRVWTKYHSPDEEFDYLGNAVKHAVEVALERKTEAIVELTTQQDEYGRHINGTTVAIIRANKFDEFGAIK